MATVRGKITHVVQSPVTHKPNPHRDLCDKAVKFLKGYCGCPVAVKEFVTFCGESPDAFGFRNSGGETYLIEVKVSRSDFFADRKKRFRIKPELGVGVFRYFMAPAGLIAISELPEKWGLIEVDEKGKCKILKGKNPKSYHSDGFEFIQRNIAGEMQIIYSLARRLAQGDDCSKWV